MFKNNIYLTIYIEWNVLERELIGTWNGNVERERGTGTETAGTETAGTGTAGTWNGNVWNVEQERLECEA